MAYLNDTRRLGSPIIMVLDVRERGSPCKHTLTSFKTCAILNVSSVPAQEVRKARSNRVRNLPRLELSTPTTTITCADMNGDKRMNGNGRPSYWIHTQQGWVTLNCLSLVKKKVVFARFPNTVSRCSFFDPTLDNYGGAWSRAWHSSDFYKQKKSWLPPASARFLCHKKA